MKTLLFLVAITGYGAMSSFDNNNEVTALANQAYKLLKVDSSAGTSVKYTTALVKSGEIRQTVKATGTLNATIDVDVGSQLSGQIDKLFVDFNDDVKKGQKLAVLDQRTFIAQVAQNAAAYAKAQEDVKIAEEGLERAKVNADAAELQRVVLAARVTRARIQLAMLKKDASRKTILNQKGAVSAMDLIDAIANEDEAAASLDEAEAILAEQDNEITGTHVDLQRAGAELASSQAVLQQAAAALQIARVNLARTTIRSPIDGVVVGRNVDKGQTLATALEAHTLFTIAGNLKRMEIYAKIDESDIGKIHPGQKATFTVDAFPGRTFTATVRQVRMAPQVLQNVVTYTAVLTTSNPDRILLPGMTALATITTSTTGPVLTVPLAALRFSPGSGVTSRGAVSSGDKIALWTPGKSGRAEQVSAIAGDDDGSDIAVTGGTLAAGSRVIIGEKKDESSARLFGIRVGL